jgi:predicted house-cleaning NTP pyrophosphatase (Maf/HAM1 superfamily)
MRGAVPFEQLPKELQDQLIDDGQVEKPKRERQARMTMDTVRGHAIKALTPLASLSQAERRRVLRHALEMNEF